MGFDGFYNRFGVRGTNPLVDIQAIGRTPNGNDIGTQFMKHLGCNLIGCAIGSIHHNLHALQGEVIAESAFAKLDVPARSIV